MDKELRPYQQQIVDRVLGSDRDDIICLPTGAGKTVIANAIMEGLSGKCIFIVPRLELISQARDEFGEVDVIWSDKTEITGKKVIIASKDSLRTQYQKLDFPENEHFTAIFDEAHVGIKQTKSLVDTMMKKYPSMRVLGLTATPERMDGLALLKGTDQIHRYGVFDSVLQEETVVSLIGKHYLSPLRYYAKPIDGITDIRPSNATGEELDEDQMTAIMNEHNIWGDMVDCYQKYGLGRPAVGFTVTVSMAETVCGVFEKAGYDFRVIHGGMNVKERKELINALTEGKIHGLVNAALLTYGFDCPPVSYAFSVRHIKSRPLWFQMVGRILRLSEGKEDAIFIDHGDSISEFSEPANPLPILAPRMDWRADGESKEAKQIKKKLTKKAQKTMKLIQKFTSLSDDMVEITTEDIYERLVELLMEKQDEIDAKEKELEALTAKIERLNAQAEAVEKRYASATRVAAQKEAELQEARQVIKQKDKEIAQVKKTEDSERTFEYIKKNYCRIRNTIRSQNPALPGTEQHKLTEKAIRDAEDKLDFYFSEYTLKSSLQYWEKHYTPDWQRPTPKPEARPLQPGTIRT